MLHKLMQRKKLDETIEWVFFCEGGEGVGKQQVSLIDIKQIKIAYIKCEFIRSGWFILLFRKRLLYIRFFIPYFLKNK